MMDYQNYNIWNCFIVCLFDISIYLFFPKKQVQNNLFVRFLAFLNYHLYLGTFFYEQNVHFPQTYFIHYI